MNNNRYISMVLNEDSVQTMGCVLNESYESKPMNIKYNEKCDTTIFQAILQEAEVPNRNGRIYTKKAIQEALDRPFIKEKIKRKTWYGENGHPFEKDDTRRQAYLDRTKVSHIVLNYWWEGNLLWGTVETTATVAGRDFQGLIRQGCGVSFSMRGLGGSVKKRKDGIDVIDNDLFIYCYDNVDFPSHDKAYIQNILKEDMDLSSGSVINTGVLNESFDPFNMNVSVERLSEEADIRTLIEGKTDSIERDKIRTLYNESISRQAIDNFLISL